MSTAMDWFVMHVDYFIMGYFGVKFILWLIFPTTR